MSALAGALGAVGLALYAGHHVGDYWVQTDHQAAHKGKAGREGQEACFLHVITYTATQGAFLAATIAVAGIHTNLLAVNLGLLVSAVTHYLADRREFGIMFRLARLLPGKARFLTLGVPRDLVVDAGLGSWWKSATVKLDNPSLGTGAWALDQSWHIFWGVFVAALVIVGLS
jgi:hypothetical protein